MSPDDLFRRIIAGFVIGLLPFALYYRMRSMTDERLDRWQEGRLILFGLRLSGVPAFVGGIAWLIEPKLMDWSSVPLPLWLRWIGVGIVLLDAVLLMWTFRHLGTNLTDTVVTRKNHTLVTSGPYRYVRHPFYMTFFLAVVGGSLVAANWFLLLTGLVPFAFIVARTRIEEAKLLDRFGDEYRQYMARTGRFFPRFAR